MSFLITISFLDIDKIIKNLRNISNLSSSIILSQYNLPKIIAILDNNSFNSNNIRFFLFKYFSEVL